DAGRGHLGRVGEGVVQRDRIGDLPAVAVQELDVVAEHAVAEAEQGGGELGGDAGVGGAVGRVGVVGVVARVGGQRVRPEQRGGPPFVGDDLHLGADEGAGPLVDVLGAHAGVGGGDQARQPVVLAHEQGVQRGQLDVLVGPDVAGREELVVGDAVGVVA